MICLVLDFVRITTGEGGRGGEGGGRANTKSMGASEEITNDWEHEKDFESDN